MLWHKYIIKPIWSFSLRNGEPEEEMPIAGNMEQERTKRGDLIRY